MKFLIAVLVVVVCYVQADLTPEQLDKMQNMLKECKEKTEVTDEDVSLLMQHKIPETQNGKCFAACIKKKLGILDADNKINMERVTELMEKIKDKAGDNYEPMMKIFETCAAEVPGGSDECEVTEKLMECCIREFKENDIEFNFMNLLSH